jgi:hypothetical protein
MHIWAKDRIFLLPAMLHFRYFSMTHGLLGPTHKMKKKHPGIWKPDTVQSKGGDGV